MKDSHFPMSSGRNRAQDRGEKEKHPEGGEETKKGKGRKGKKRPILIAVAIALVLFAIGSFSDPAEDSPAETTVSNSQQTEQSAQTTVSQSATQVPDPADLPAYSGKSYVTVNDNIPWFTEDDLTDVSFETYSELDSLGRCGAAYASIGTDLMPDQDRGSIASVTPTGWHSVAYQGVVDGDYLYNRCHLIGYQLTAENDNEKNLITGTRYLNVEGMLPFENMVADYVLETGNHVLYRVTPVFEGDNLVASGVLMESMSVEDQGEDIMFNVYCYNIQPGVVIDYATGDSHLEEGVETEPATTKIAETEPATTKIAETEPATTQPATTEPATTQPATTKIVTTSKQTDTGTTYILNTNTKKFHKPSCSSVKQMSEENKEEYTGTRDEVIAMGYDPCKRCNP